MSRFTYQLEPGGAEGTWQWQILDPRGDVWAYGARRDTKRNVEAMLKKIVARHNPRGRCPVGFNNQDLEAEARSQRRGGASAARARRRTTPGREARA